METIDERRDVLVDPVVLDALARAAGPAGLDFDALGEGLIAHATQENSARSIKLPDYFNLLHRLANVSNDETLAMSDRPLMAGAFHYVLQQSSKLSNFEELLQHFAKSFNLLHGGNYNHVIRRADMVIYRIDVDGFPYPFDLSVCERATLLDCILILVHTLFEICVSSAVSQSLIEVRSTYPVSNADAPPYQLQFWPCRVAANKKVFELCYDLSSLNLPVTVHSADLPAENDIYRHIARFINRAGVSSERHLEIEDQIRPLILHQNVSETEVAEALNVSVRTLRRRLQTRGLTFAKIRDHALNGRAKQLLQQNLLVESIAEKLGYADARSFRRAFARWNGETPNDFQQRAPR